MPAADEVMLYKAFNSLFNSLFKWKGSVFLPFLNSSLDIVAKTYKNVEMGSWYIAATVLQPERAASGRKKALIAPFFCRSLLFIRLRLQRTNLLVYLFEIFIDRVEGLVVLELIP